MPQPRLMIDAPLAAGAELALDENQSRHVGTVLRLDVGDGLRVFNAREGEWRAAIVEKTKRGLRVRVESFIRAARAAPDLDLLFAPVKRHATDLIIEKATELGVRRIRPVITQRTIAETVRLDRLEAIAREAAEQTERFDAPEILEPLALAKALDGWDVSRRLIYADEAGDDDDAPWGGERGKAKPLLDTLFPSPRGEGAGGGANLHASSITPPPNPLLSRGGGMALLIGPEGGFTPEERAALRSFAFVMPVSLGPRILRAETAVIAALAVIQSAWGDWRLDPRA
ncbi:MAG TPA: 16S rRNA (uracil(1498)-N(3))-methyltransferase [Caulobacterales bacterium]|nr:16S rRNA (uracil(1498)-N(3))-methyltransferase [Caulobacterales bacterium]